ncbi:MAG: DUF1724 domain-containing protein [Methanosarcinales archaeon]|nr:MAG: DUF1724 domain-containing protein [Methanosarcinales archaeon]
MKSEDAEVLEAYKDIRECVQSILRSRLQTQILLSLCRGIKTLGQLREVTGSSSQAIIPKIRKLESLHLVEGENREYRLTPVGKVVSSGIDDIIRTIGTFRRHDDFWANHYIEAIPKPLLKDISDLLDSEIVIDANADIFRSYANFLQILKDADRIWGVSSVTTPGFTEAIVGRVREGIDVDLVVSRDIAEQLALQEPYKECLRALAGYPNFRLRATDKEMKLGVTVTDKCLSLGLYKKDEITYDRSMDLISCDEKAIRWGERLFNYYKERSRIIDANAL